MSTVCFPTKFKFEAIKSGNGAGYEDKIQVERDHIKACNGYIAIIAKHIQDADIKEEVVSNEDLAYTRKKFAKQLEMPINTVDYPMPDINSVLPNYEDNQKFIVSFNVENLAQIAKVMDVKMVTLLIDTPGKGILVLSDEQHGESDSFGLLMPCRLNTDLDKNYCREYLESINKA